MATTAIAPLDPPTSLKKKGLKKRRQELLLRSSSDIREGFCFNS